MKSKFTEDQRLTMSERARIARLEVGRRTKDLIVGFIADSPVPLTINEVNELYFRERKKPLERGYLGTLLNKLVEDGELKMRFETKDETAVSSHQGSAARLYGTGKSIKADRNDGPPFVTGFRATKWTPKKKKKKKAQASSTKPVSASASTESLGAMIAELEATVAKIKNSIGL